MLKLCVKLLKNYKQRMQDIKPKNFTVYRSSAGSGKTYTLVKEYLKIILVDPSKFRNILAITFTNKAAKEMKDRILGNLGDLSGYSDNSGSEKTNDLLQTLVKETNLTQEEIITNSSDALWWIMATVTTVGYGDVYPVTNAGRVVGVIVMITGIGLFGTITGFLANAFFQPKKTE